MGDWDHMGRVFDFGQWLIGMLFLALVVAVPLAIWKIVDIFRWMF